MSRADWALLLVTLLVAVVAFFLWKHDTNEFQKACYESGGTAVWNGQYYQCIYRKGGGNG